MNAIATLWRRAPIWRFCFVFAALTSIVTLLASPPVTRLLSDRPVPVLVDSGGRFTSSSTAQQTPTPSRTLVAPPPPSVRPVPLQAGTASQFFSGRIDVGGRGIPLPAGTLLLLGLFKTPVGFRDSWQAVLAASENGIVTLLVTVHATDRADPYQTGFRAFDGCKPDGSALFSNTRTNDDFGFQDCYVGFTSWFPRGQPPDTRTPEGFSRAQLDHHRLPMPEHMLSVLYRFADRDGFVVVTYHFNPEAVGIATRPISRAADSEWLPSYLAQDPDKMAYSRQAEAWAAAWHRYVRDGFAGNPQRDPAFFDLASAMLRRGGGTPATGTRP